MLDDIWTKAQFRANSRSASVFGRRKALLAAIDEALDTLHAAAPQQQMTQLHFVDAACRAWLTAHPNTSATPMPGKKLSSRRKGVEALRAQIKLKLAQRYGRSPKEEGQTRAIMGRYEKDNRVLNVAPGDVDPRNMKSRAAFHQELLKATIDRAEKLGHDKADFNPEQIGFLTAKTALSIDSVIDEKRRAKCEVEAMRILGKMLGKNRELALRFEASGVKVIVVPADRPMTDLPEFASLKGVNINQAGGTPRTWDPTRGVGGVEVTRNGATTVYVAITEENLLGTDTTGAARAAGGGCYEARYSTTSHEFAHSLHQRAMTSAQKNLIKRCFDRKKKALIDNNTRVVTISESGFVPTQHNLDALFQREWVDGPRQKSAALPAAMEYWVYNTARSAYVMNPDGRTYLKYRTTWELQDCYAAFDEFEYFAQCVNAYLGSNGGRDPYTGRPRHNDLAWLRVNEEAALNELLSELFSAGSTNTFGKANLEDTNVIDDGTDEATVGDYIRHRVMLMKHKNRVLTPDEQYLRGAITARRPQFDDADD